MSMILKWVVALLVLVGAGWLLWWSGWLQNMNAKSLPAAVSSSVATSTVAAAHASLNGMSAANDSSDIAVAQDVLAVDAQLKALGADGSQVAASFADKPIAQSY